MSKRVAICVLHPDSPRFTLFDPKNKRSKFEMVYLPSAVPDVSEILKSIAENDAVAVYIDLEFGIGNIISNWSIDAFMQFPVPVELSSGWCMVPNQYL